MCVFWGGGMGGRICLHPKAGSHVHVHVAASVLEADVVADLAGGAGSGLGQEEPPVGADADLVDAGPAPGG